MLGFTTLGSEANGALPSNTQTVVGIGFPQSYTIFGRPSTSFYVAPIRTVNFDGGTNRVAFDGGANRVDF